MTLISYVDDAIMALILLLAFDQVRRVTVFTHPLATVVFILLCVGSFGKVVHSIAGGPPPWWAVTMHAGFGLLLVRALGTSPNYWNRLHGLFPRRNHRSIARLVPQTQGRQRPHPSD